MSKRFVCGNRYLEIELKYDSVEIVTHGDLGDSGDDVKILNISDVSAYQSDEKRISDDAIEKGYRLVSDIPKPSEDEEDELSELTGEVEYKDKKAVNRVLGMDEKDLGSYAMDRFLSLGLQLAESKGDDELRKFCLERLPASTQCKELVFWMSAEASRNGDRKKAIEYAEKAVELGCTTAQFADFSVFSSILLDERFRSAIRVENTDSEYYLLRVDNENMITSEDREELIGGRRRSKESSGRALCFNVDSDEKVPPHMFIVDYDDLLVVSKPVCDVLLGDKIPKDSFKSFSPVELTYNGKKLEGYHIFRVKNTFDVTDKELTQDEWEYFGGRPVLNDLKLKTRHVIFNTKAGLPTVIRDDIYDAIVAAVPPEKWGVDVIKLTVSEHRPISCLELTADEWLGEFEGYYNNKQLNMAKECADALMEKYPGYAPGWNAAGLIYGDLAKDMVYDKEESGYKETLALFEKAIEYLGKAIKLDPGSGRPWAVLGSIHGTSVYKSNRTDSIEELDLKRSVECWYKAAELDGDDNSYLHLLELLSGEEYRNTVDTWAERYPENPHPPGLLGDLYYDDEKYSEAVEYLKRSVALRPTGMALYHLAYSYLHLRELDRMEEAIGMVTEDLLGYSDRDMHESYLIELKGKLRSARKEIERKNRTAEPVVFVKTELHLELEKRLDECWRKLKDVSDHILTVVNISPDDIRRSVDSIDRGALVKRYREEFEEMLSRIDDAEKYDGFVFEWYYAGSDSHTDATGSLCKCNVTDDNDPNGFGDVDYLDTDNGDLEIGPVMGEWVEKFCPELEGLDEDLGCFGTPDLIEGVKTVWEIYFDIFDYTLDLILAEAYSTVTEPRTKYLFMGTHDNSPGRMIVSPGSKKSR